MRIYRYTFTCLLLFIFLFGARAYSQTILSENFEGFVPPAGWLAYPNDNWSKTSTYYESGNYCLASEQNSGGNKISNWMFSKPLSLVAGERYRISYWYRLVDNYYTNNLNFRVTLSNTTDSGIQNTIHNYPYTTFNSIIFQEGVDYYVPSASGNFYLGLNCNAANRNFSEGMLIDSVVIQKIPDCSGTPLLSAVSGPSSGVCYLDTTRLSLTGDYTASGLNLQWQSSPHGTGTFTDIAGATTSTLNTFQSTALDYRCAAVCALSNSATVVSNVYPVAMKSQCYYANSSYCYSNYISNVTISNLNNTSTCSSNGYIYYSALPSTILYRGAQMQIQVKAPQQTDIAVWVDYNNNGMFDSTEYVNLGKTDATGSIGGVINIPANAVLATTRMRVKCSAYINLTSRSADTTNYIPLYGETEDYNVTINDITPCTTAPIGGSANSSSYYVCPLASFTLGVTGSSISGVVASYQWQSSPNGTNWSDIAGANLVTLTTTQSVATYYRRNIICNNSLSAYSSSVLIQETPFANCYCVPTSNCSAPYKIDSVLFANMAVATGACTSTAYNFPNNNTIPAVHAGSYEKLTVRLNSSTGYSRHVKCFIDFNHDGSFDGANEVFDFGTASSSTYILTKYIKIPFEALTGTTYMRIRLSANGSTYPPYTSCSTESSGETDDYTINILPQTSAAIGFVYYVKAGVTGANSGTSWNDAFTDLASAINIAKAKDTIKIAKGIYIVSNQYTLQDSLVILGGYPDTGNPVDTDRNWGTNQTRINGNNQVKLFYGYNLHPTTILDGLILENGYANGYSSSDYPQPTGVAIELFAGANPVIKNCVFRNNINTSFQETDEAASIECNNSNPIISNCFFFHNKGGDASDIYCGAGSSMTFTNCVFSNDNVHRVIHANGSNVQILNCTFFGDTTSEGSSTSSNAGVVYASTNAIVSINNTIFFNHQSPGVYGGVATSAFDDISIKNATLLISNTITQVYQPADLSFFGLRPKFRDTSNVAGPDGLFFTSDDGLQLTNIGSKALNGGNNSAIAGISKDIIGNPRIFNTTVDLGAYELQAAPLPIPTVLYVKANATGANNGTSWSNAFTVLQQALELSSDTVKIASGTYHPTATDPSVSFWLEKKRVLLGGYPNTGNPGDNLRDPVNNPSILSGRLSGGVQSYSVVRGEGIDSTSIADGLTIIGAKSGYNSEGAGIYLTNHASPVFKNCIVTNNSTGLYAAGLDIRYSSNPTFLNCTFSNNGDPIDNTLDGGSIFISDSSSPLFRKCFFGNNSTEIEESVPGEGIGGAMYNANYCNPIIDSCTFTKNSANFEGGAIANFNNSNPIITNTGFYSNFTGTPSDYNYGSGNDILNDNSSPQITNCTFSDSSSANAGGSILNQNNSNPVFTNCMFNNGNARQGSVCYNDNSNPVFKKCWFSHATTTYYSTTGAVFYNANSSNLIVTNCVATDNNAFMYNNSASSALIIGSTFVNNGTIVNLNANCNVVIKNSIYDSLGGITSNVTILNSIKGAIARFMDSTNAPGPDKKFFTNDDGLKLCSCSPAINAGNNTYAAGTTSDVINNPRIFDNTVDIGAYETQSSVITLPKVYYVNASANGANDGSSWANAYTNLQSAILNTCADTIKIAQGTYKAASFSRDSSFRPSRPVVVYGGYPAGGNQDDSMRNPDIYPSILDGDIGNIGDSSDNTYTIMRLNDPSPLEGLTFAHNNNIPISGGSSLTIYAALITNNKVKNCRFYHNTGTTLYGNADISNSVFHHNYTTAFGTIYNPDTIRDCIIDSNVASEGAGFYTDVKTVVENTIFYSNHAQTAGAAYLYSDPHVKFINCDFVRNDAYNSVGVGIYDIQYTSYPSFLTVDNCIFKENTVNGFYGEYQHTDWAYIGNGYYPNDFDDQQNIHHSAIVTESDYDNTNILSSKITFKDINNLKGADGMWFTKDDGLQLSPATIGGLDAANNASVATIPVDIIGGPRIFNAQVDMGAYEYIGVSAGPDVTVCTGGSKQIGISNKPNFSYTWTSIPAGFSSNISNPVVSPASTTIYSVSATDGVSNYTDTVIANVILPPLAYAGNDTTVCFGDSATIGSVGNNNGNGYSWTNSLSNFYTSTVYPTIKVKPSIATSYYLNASNAGCSTKDTVLVSVNTVPAINAGNDSTICPGDSIIIGPTTTGAITYSWTSLPVGFVSSDANPTVKSATLSTSYYLLASNGIGACPSKDTVVISTVSFPAGAAGHDTSLCAGNNAVIGQHPSLSVPYSSSWISAPAGFTSISFNPTVNPSASTDYILTLTKGVCSIKDTVTVTIDTNHIVADAGADKNICGTEDVTLGASVFNHDVTYDWESAIGFISSAANPVVHVSNTSYYYLSVTDNICTLKDTVLISMQLAPSTGISDTLTTMCIGNTIAIGGFPQTGYSYDWSSIPSGFTSSLSEPLVSPTIATIYYLVVTDNATGCKDSGQVSVIADSCSNNNISVYPNPAGNEIHLYIDSVGQQQLYFKLTNEYGGVMMNIPVSNNIIINVSNIPSGAYFYTVVMDSGEKLKSGVLIITH